MRKRVLCVYDGRRRLLKDEMMLGNEFEVRVPLPGPGDRRIGGFGAGHVTDLDVQTVKRAIGFLDSGEEERGGYVDEFDLVVGLKNEDGSGDGIDLEALMS